MPALQDDPDIREAHFCLEEKLTLQQVRFVGARRRDLLDRYDAASCEEQLWPIEWSEWPAFIDAAYSCGFVCCDGSEEMGDREKTPVQDFIRRLEADLGRVDSLSRRDLRKVLHYIMRSERWADSGADIGGGAIWELITSRLGDAIARRLGA